MSEVDKEMMARALEVARLGDPAPNPRVGAVLAHGKLVVAEGFHREAGLEHAEIVALNAAGARARGATLYVTLEPCTHQGRTPPCVPQIINAGIKRVVIGCRDPNPNFPRAGVENLREAGLEVELGVLGDECSRLIRPWRQFITKNMSYVALKLGISLDGRIATRTGISHWITCPEARAKSHSLRAQNDAVMVGVNTVVADDPELTVREAPGRNPVRVVVDSGLRVPFSSKVIASAAETPTCIVTTHDSSQAVADALTEKGVAVIRVSATAEGRCDMSEALSALAAREVVSVLCEGGAELAGSLLAQHIPGELHVFVAPRLLGPRGRSLAVDWAGPETPEQAPYVEHPRWEVVGTDAYVSGLLAYPKKKKRAPQPE